MREVGKNWNGKVKIHNLSAFKKMILKRLGNGFKFGFIHCIYFDRSPLYISIANVLFNLYQPLYRYSPSSGGGLEAPARLLKRPGRRTRTWRRRWRGSSTPNQGRMSCRLEFFMCFPETEFGDKWIFETWEFISFYEATKILKFVLYFFSLSLLIYTRM